VSLSWVSSTRPATAAGSTHERLEACDTSLPAVGIEYHQAGLPD
jgi:hypothetical protein